MKTRPIGFTQENVKATHDGLKTMTRRVIDFDPFLKNNEHFRNNYTFRKMFYDDRENRQVAIFGYIPSGDKYGFSEWVSNPYGQAGDRFWLKETWGICNYSLNFEEVCKLQIAYKAGKTKINPHPDGMTHDLEWRTVDLKTWHKYTDGFNFKWRGGRFMPRFASRTELELVSVGVEQLQEISPEDAVAEGCRERHFYNDRGALTETALPRGVFITLWDSINGKKHPWESNPWVWVLGYKLVEREAGL